MCKSSLGILLVIALASCKASNRPWSQANGNAAGENATPTRLQLTSDAFANGQPIPAQYTCEGINKRPTLRWGKPPVGTKSFALVVDDPDAPNGTFRHWGVFDIPASERSVGGQAIGIEVLNDFGKPGYGGPCPPRGHGSHHYHFNLFALDTDRLGISPNGKVIDVENAAKQHAIAEGELIGTYERR